jgi:hypothetical protein
VTFAPKLHALSDFLRGGEVKVFSLHYGLDHAGYPLNGKEAALVPGKAVVTLYQ